MRSLQRSEAQCNQNHRRIALKGPRDQIHPSVTLSSLKSEEMAASSSWQTQTQWEESVRLSVSRPKNKSDE